MEARAIAKYLGLSPRKTRIPADIVRGMSVVNALNTLKYMQKATALPVSKVIESAYANAKNNNKMNSDSLYISEIKIDNGPTQRRIYFKGKGGYSFFKRPTSHITVILSDIAQPKVLKTIKSNKKGKVSDNNEQSIIKNDNAKVLKIKQKIIKDATNQ